MFFGLKKRLLNWYVYLNKNKQRITNKEPQMNNKNVSYIGKSVYIRIDVHKKSYTFSAYCDGIVCKIATTPADPDNFAKSLKKWFSGAKIFSVYEAGFIRDPLIAVRNLLQQDEWLLSDLSQETKIPYQTLYAWKKKKIFKTKQIKRGKRIFIIANISKKDINQLTTIYDSHPQNKRSKT